ncbi:nucleotidyltransferase domain-containing protein [Salicibibacter cibarius]|uniref:Nucleotidyltransferase domain-containing protein n=1 Tax=Salicibibacter cibarius TaxID=2743000 RepID=A0A7T7CDM7_9BACI|nr:nucleotidyltransferase domain-containing protein [Salicibibacter cibarius]
MEKLVLFGSRARGDYRKSSDIDLAVFTNSSHSQQNLMEQSIYELPTLLKIDVVFMSRLSKEKMISNILKEGAVIYK